MRRKKAIYIQGSFALFVAFLSEGLANSCRALDLVQWQARERELGEAAREVSIKFEERDGGALDSVSLAWRK